MRKISFLALFIVSLATFGQNTFYVIPNFASIGNDHKIIAVIPFKTTISLRPKQMQKLKDGELNKMQMDESLNIQHAMYSWFLRRQQQGSMWVDIQDVATTNAILAKNGIDYDNIADHTPKEIAAILGVDAVVRGTFSTDKPMSEGASLALGLLVGFYGTTNTAKMNMFIQNAEDGKVLVNYNKAVSGSLGSSTDQLINKLMRKCSRKIPYTKPKE